MGSSDSGLRISDIAATFLEEIRTIQHSGPYHLVGHCWGGIVVLEIATQLEAVGEKTGSVALLESYPPKPVATAADNAGISGNSNAQDLHQELGFHRADDL